MKYIRYKLITSNSWELYKIITDLNIQSYLPLMAGINGDRNLHQFLWCCVRNHTPVIITYPDNNRLIAISNNSSLFCPTYCFTILNKYISSKIMLTIQMHRIQASGWTRLYLKTSMSARLLYNNIKTYLHHAEKCYKTQISFLYKIWKIISEF